MHSPDNINDAQTLAELLRPSWPTISARIAASGVPTCLAGEDELKEKLKQVESELSQAREENAVLRRERDRTRADYAKSRDNDPNSQPFKRATKAVEELAKVQVGVLKMMGRGGRVAADRNGPRSGDFGHGWEHIAHSIDLEGGRSRVDVPVVDLLRGSPMAAGVTISPSSGLTSPQIMEPFTPLPQDVRHIWRHFPGQQVDPGILAVSDFKQKGSRTVTGTVERDPVATSSKATLGLEVELETPPLKQLAIVIEKVPVKLLSAIDTFAAWLQNEAAYQVSLALDVHCLAQVKMAKPPHEEEGATMVEKARLGVAAMRAVGAVPTVLALAPAEAAALDTQKSGTAGLEQNLFSSRDTGTSSPLWGMEVVEVPNIDKPTLIDPVTTGYLYTGMAQFQVDPFTGLGENLVRVRLEMEVLLHIRNALGSYRLSKT